jgi:hypothetical protein
MHEAPPHLPPIINKHTPSAHIKKVLKTHIFQVINDGQAGEDSDSDDEDPLDIFQVFAAKKKKHETR